jgi:hypothetical protein
MLRKCAVLSLALTIVAIGVVRADESKNNRDNQSKDRIQAVISNVDPQKDSITVKTSDKDGKQQTKTFHIDKDTKLLASDGRAAKLATFRPGDNVCITKKKDEVTEIRKHAEATITKINPKAGEITVKMPDKDGRQTEKTFKLVEDAEYLDSSGRVAVLDVFQSGDDILMIESEGMIEAMKKAPRDNAATTARRGGNKSGTR